MPNMLNDYAFKFSGVVMLSLFDIFAVAVAMSIDAFCVSVCVGMKYNSLNKYLRLGFFFGFFQFLMPVIGAYIGTVMLNYTQNIKYLAAAILFVIAFMMFKEGWCNKECKVYTSDPTKGLKLIMLSLATSMDALGAGISLAFYEGGIIFASAVIGVTCFLFTCGGIFFGSVSSRYIGHYAEYFGAFVLTAIGLKFIL
jgi:putative Mn2+ efflux pump MntP